MKIAFEVWTSRKKSSQPNTNWYHFLNLIPNNITHGGSNNFLQNLPLNNCRHEAKFFYKAYNIKFHFQFLYINEIGFNFKSTHNTKKIHTIIQSYIITSASMIKSHIYYLNNHANKKFWLDNSIKKIYIVSASKLNTMK